MAYASLSYTNNGWWNLNTPYDEDLNVALRSIPGVQWDNNNKCRRVHDSFLPIIDSTLAEFDIKSIVTVEKPNPGSSLIALPNNIDLATYQVRALRNLITNPGAHLLAWEMGAGKTLPTLLAAQESRQPVVIVAPAHVCPNWWAEIRKWRIKISPTVLSYASLVTRKEPIDSYGSFLIIDEIQYVKNPKSKRTKELRHLINQSITCVGLTGTVMPNNTMELFTILDMLFPKVFGSRTKFAMRYAGAKLKTIPAGPNEGKQALDIPNLVDLPAHQRAEICNLNELSMRFSRMADVVTAKDIEHTLPELRIRKERIQADSIDRQRINFLQSSLLNKNKRARGELLDVAAAIKVPKVVNDVRKDSRTQAIFTWRKETAKSIQGLLINQSREIFMLTGDVTADKRYELIKEARKKRKRQTILICTIDAVQTGLDLTFCNVVRFAELVFVPAKISQSIKRFHRRGQKHNVEVYTYVVQDTLDERVTDINTAKIDAISNVTGGADTEGLFSDSLVIDEEKELSELLLLLQGG